MNGQPGNPYIDGKVKNYAFTEGLNATSGVRRELTLARTKRETDRKSSNSLRGVNAFLFQARRAATRPRRRVSSRASGRGRATTPWRTNSPGARG